MRMQGQTAHVPLNDKGIAQARAAAALLAQEKIDLIISSTLERAAQTARIIEETKPVPVIYDERLIERCWGLGEGLTLDEIKEKPDDFFMPDGSRDFVFDSRQPKGSETREQLASRAVAAVEDLVAAHGGKRLLLVTHGAWIRALIFKLTGQDYVIENALPYIATQTQPGGTWQIKPLR